MRLLAAFLLPFVVVWGHSLKWEKLNASNHSVPAPRLGAAAVSMGGQVMIHGGCSSSCCYAPLSDMWVWKSGIWSQIVSTSKSIPSGRVYHTALHYGQSVFVFAGNNVENGFLNDFWAYHHTNNTWDLVFPQGKSPVPARAGHTADLYNSVMLVFGGRNASYVLDDAWMLDLENMQWKQIQSQSRRPPARVNHASTIISSRRGGKSLLIFGGANALGQTLRDTWELDLSTMEWVALDVQRPPVARQGHLLWSLPSNSTHAILFGGQIGTRPTSPFLDGVALFDASTESWSQLTPQSNDGKPSARAFMSVVKGSLEFFGGFSGYSGGLGDHLHNGLWTLTDE